jgi:hypothetical protein
MALSSLDNVFVESETPATFFNNAAGVGSFLVKVLAVFFFVAGFELVFLVFVTILP